LSVCKSPSPKKILALDGGGIRAMNRGLGGGLIERYEEIFERAQVLARLGFADERIVKSVRKWAR